MSYPVIAQADDLEHFQRGAKLWPHLLEPSNPIRRRIIKERMVIRKAARDLIAFGFQLRVYDGEDFSCDRTADLGVIMSNLNACDEEMLYVYRPSADSKTGWARFASIYLVYGNDGWDVIADNSVSLESCLKGATELADKLAA